MRRDIFSPQDLKSVSRTEGTKKLVKFDSISDIFRPSSLLEVGGSINLSSNQCHSGCSLWRSEGDFSGPFWIGREILIGQIHGKEKQIEVAVKPEKTVKSLSRDILV